MVVLMVKVPNSGIDLSIILYMCKKQICVTTRLGIIKNTLDTQILTGKEKNMFSI